MDYRICIIGLGYVGLPLAVEFGKKYPTLGYDIDCLRISELKNNFDKTLELNELDIKKVNSKSFTKNKKGLYFTDKSKDLKKCNFYIITVPTPVDIKNNPILEPILSATELVSKHLLIGDIVVYESTVYPGLTEEVCVPIIEKISGLKFNKGFYVGYSPERINPGDKERTITKIKKITSGSTPEKAVEIDKLYKSIITAGTHLASSIKVAEAAKVIENSQRDINIAFINELAKIFNLLEINTQDVLDAAATKWNFLNFKPGLVGGHCIGVDPYYLANKAIKHGYNPEVILSGRKLNDSMGKYVAHQVISLMEKKDIEVKSSDILILGITFKENCPDVRNTKVVDIISNLKKHGCNINVYDPIADAKQVKKEYKISLIKKINNLKFDTIILAVSHSEFLDLDLDLLKNKKAVVYDVKGILKEKSDLTL